MPKRLNNEQFFNAIYGGASTSNSARCGGKGERDYNPTVDRPNAPMLFCAQTDFGFEDVCTSVLPSHNPRTGPRNEVRDLDRIYQWLQKREMEKEGGTTETIERKAIHHVRYHDGLNKAVNKFIELSERSGNCFVISLDTEGGDSSKEDRFPSTLQLSGKCGNDECNVVFQLKSELVKSPSSPPRHIFDEGQPTRLLEIFRLRKARFGGKDVAHDLQLIYREIGLSEEEYLDLKIIDTTRIYKFSHALAQSGDELSSWLDGGDVGLLEDISLKDFCQFVNPKKIIDKTTHRNHYANFKDKGGQAVRDKDIRYAAGDTLFVLRRLLEFQDMTGLNLEIFSTTIEKPHIPDDDGFMRAVEKYVETEHMSDSAIRKLPAREMNIVQFLRSAKLILVPKIAKSQVNLCEFRLNRADCGPSLFLAA